MASDERILHPDNYPFGLMEGMTKNEVRDILERIRIKRKERMSLYENSEQEFDTIIIPNMRNEKDNRYYDLICKFRFYGTPRNLYEIRYRDVRSDVSC